MPSDTDLFDFAPEFGEEKIKAKYLTYTFNEAWWSLEPPLIMSDLSIRFPILSYRQAWTNRDGSPKIIAGKGHVKVISRGESVSRPPFLLTRKKVLEWAHHQDQEDTFVTMAHDDWIPAYRWPYERPLNEYYVWKNGAEVKLKQVVKEWFEGREL